MNKIKLIKQIIKGICPQRDMSVKLTIDIYIIDNTRGGAITIYSSENVRCNKKNPKCIDCQQYELNINNKLYKKECPNEEKIRPWLYDNIKTGLTIE